MTLTAFCLIAGLALLLAMAVIDLRSRILPDSLNLLLAAGAVAFHAAAGWAFLSPWECAAGAIAGAASFWTISYAYRLMRGRTGLGLGDVKFMAGAGLWLGPWSLPMLVAIASLATLATVLLLTRLGTQPAGDPRSRAIPFGPGLSVALALLLIQSYGTVMRP